MIKTRQQWRVLYFPMHFLFFLEWQPARPDNFQNVYFHGDRFTACLRINANHGRVGFQPVFKTHKGMAMVQYILSWFAVTIAFILADGIWLGFIAREFYKRQIGSLMRDEVWFAIAGMFYLIYTISVVVLVVVPAHKSGSIAQAMILGGLLGLCAYGTYDVTNLATLKGWPVTVAIVDVTWGTLLTAAISTVGFLVMDWSKNL